MARLILLASVMLMGSYTSADELYRWVDESGSVHYSDIPVAVPSIEKKKLGAGPADPDAGLPYEIRRAKQNFPVVLYVAENCGEICQEARDLLRKRGVPFEEKNLKTQEDFAAFKQLSGNEGVPSLAVGKVWLKGLQARQWNDELGAAGYPDIPTKP